MTPARQQPQHFREAEIGPKWISLPQWFKMHDYVTLASGKLYHPAHPPNDDFPISWTTDEEINPCALHAAGWPCDSSVSLRLGAVGGLGILFCQLCRAALGPLPPHCPSRAGHGA